MSEIRDVIQISIDDRDTVFMSMQATIDRPLYDLTLKIFTAVQEIQVEYMRRKAIDVSGSYYRASKLSGS